MDGTLVQLLNEIVSLNQAVMEARARIAELERQLEQQDAPNGRLVTQLAQATKTWSGEVK